MNEYNVFDIKEFYEEKRNRKLRILESEFQLLIEEGKRFTEKQYRDREVLMSEISLIKRFLEDIDYIIEKYQINY